MAPELSSLISKGAGGATLGKEHLCREIEKKGRHCFMDSCPIVGWLCGSLTILFSQSAFLGPASLEAVKNLGWGI